MNDSIFNSLFHTLSCFLGKRVLELDPGAAAQPPLRPLLVLGARPAAISRHGLNCIEFLPKFRNKSVLKFARSPRMECVWEVIVVSRGWCLSPSAPWSAWPRRANPGHSRKSGSAALLCSFELQARTDSILTSKGQYVHVFF